METSVSTTCPKCRQPSTPTQSRLKKSDYRCLKCIAKDARAYRLRRVAKGLPVVSPRRALWDAITFQRAYADPEKRERHRARSTARSAVKYGRLIRKPCEVCGDARVEAHHDDYGQPLNVRWLCPQHHREHHAIERALSRAA